MILPFEIFPPPLHSSVITIVWVGVFAISFFNLRLGWVYSGLVVTGYITPLLFERPWVAGSILIESIVTFHLAYFTSEIMSKNNVWSSIFGRDRFFVIVLFSVFTRLVFDSLINPIFGEIINNYYGISFDYSDNLHTVGLVIVSITANAFWKVGVFRSLIPFTWQFLLTSIAMYILMHTTNFSLKNLTFAYEDVATFIDSSPKSYIIILTAAYFASQYNLKYGWDFNGIFVPSLLTLQWHQPSRILFTFSEALIIFFISKLVLKIPFFASKNIEGARKTLLFYNISFFYKFILCHIVILFGFDVKISDAFGFGYLLSTLIATKMFDKIPPLRMLSSIALVSIKSFIVAISIGYSSSLIYKYFNEKDQENKEIRNFSTIQNTNTKDQLNKIKPYIYINHKANSLRTKSNFNLLVQSSNLINPNSNLSKIAAELEKIQYQVISINQKTIVFHPYGEKNLGIYVTRVDKKNHITAFSHKSLINHLNYESLIWLYQNKLIDSFILLPRMIDNSNSLSIERILLGSKERKNIIKVSADKKQNNLLASNRIPEKLNLDQLKNKLSNFQINWINPHKQKTKKEIYLYPTFLHLNYDQIKLKFQEKSSTFTQVNHLETSDHEMKYIEEEIINPIIKKQDFQVIKRKASIYNLEYISNQKLDTLQDKNESFYWKYCKECNSNKITFYEKDDQTYDSPHKTIESIIAPKFSVGLTYLENHTGRISKSTTNKFNNNNLLSLFVQASLRSYSGLLVPILIRRQIYKTQRNGLVISEKFTYDTSPPQNTLIFKDELKRLKQAYKRIFFYDGTYPLRFYLQSTTNILEYIGFTSNIDYMTVYFPIWESDFVSLGWFKTLQRHFKYLNLKTRKIQNTDFKSSANYKSNIQKIAKEYMRSRDISNLVKIINISKKNKLKISYECLQEYLKCFVHLEENNHIVHSLNFHKTSGQIKSNQIISPSKKRLKQWVSYEQKELDE